MRLPIKRKLLSYLEERVLYYCAFLALIQLNKYLLKYQAWATSVKHLLKYQAWATSIKVVTIDCLVERNYHQVLTIWGATGLLGLFKYHWHKSIKIYWQLLFYGIHKPDVFVFLYNRTIRRGYCEDAALNNRVLQWIWNYSILHFLSARLYHTEPIGTEVYWLVCLTGKLLDSPSNSLAAFKRKK